METQHLLDVRVIEPRLKHAFIFNSFDQLIEGEILTIVNDHDPKPLYHQLRVERPGIFEWEYLEQGPRTRRVNITKSSPAEETVADLLRQNPPATSVFKKFKIDFCCKGSLFFNEACHEVGLNPLEVREQIMEAIEDAPVHLRAEEWPLDFLTDYIIKNHHAYVTAKIPVMMEMLDKVVKVHGKAHSELAEIKLDFSWVAKELAFHMYKEETILFPAIKELVRAKESQGKLAAFPFGTVRNPIRMMEDEHAGAGEDLENIRRLTRDYTLPADACSSYRLLYQLLEEFEEDLHQHVHLENNILFPKAIQLEKVLMRKQ